MTFSSFVSIIDSFLGELPESEVIAFTQTEDFSVYKTVLVPKTQMMTKGQNSSMWLTHCLEVCQTMQFLSLQRAKISKYIAQLAHYTVEVKIWVYLTRSTI